MQKHPIFKFFFECLYPMYLNAGNFSRNSIFFCLASDAHISSDIFMNFIFLFILNKTKHRFSD